MMDHRWRYQIKMSIKHFESLLILLSWFFLCTLVRLSRIIQVYFLLLWPKLHIWVNFVGIEETQSQMLYWQIELVVPSKTIVALIGIQQINLVVVSILPSKIIVAFIGSRTSNSFIYDVFKIEWKLTFGYRMSQLYIWAAVHCAHLSLTMKSNALSLLLSTTSMQ